MPKYRKALLAAFAAASAAFATAAQDGQVTGVEWGTVAGAAIVAGYAVWRVPNRPAA
jgi:hypothetical protein